MSFLGRQTIFVTLTKYMSPSHTVASSCWPARTCSGRQQTLSKCDSSCSRLIASLKDCSVRTFLMGRVRLQRQNRVGRARGRCGMPKTCLVKSSPTSYLRTHAQRPQATINFCVTTLGKISLHSQIGHQLYESLDISTAHDRDLDTSFTPRSLRLRPGPKPPR